MPINCPYCAAVNTDENAAHCIQCGKPLPAAPPVPTMMPIDGPGGTNVQAEQLRKKAGQAFGALLAVAIIQAIAGTILGFVLGGQPMVFAMLYGIAVFFFVLALWARKSPLPAAVVGLVVYVALSLFDIMAAPEAVGRGIILRIIIIVLLAKAVQAGSQYNRLKGPSGTMRQQF